MIVGTSALTALVLWAAYYTISPLFRHIRLDEAAPKMVAEETMETTSSKREKETANVFGTTGHSGSGTVRLIDTKSGTVLRYENFKTINGPDLYVYLAKDLDAKEYINLGTLKATEGNVNYDIPSGVNARDYRYALVWCKLFGVLFNYADLSNAR